MSGCGDGNEDTVGKGITKEQNEKLQKILELSYNWNYAMCLKTSLQKEAQKYFWHKTYRSTLPKNRGKNIEY